MHPLRSVLLSVSISLGGLLVCSLIPSLKLGLGEEEVPKKTEGREACGSLFRLVPPTSGATTSSLGKGAVGSRGGPGTQRYPTFSSWAGGLLLNEWKNVILEADRPLDTSARKYARNSQIPLSGFANESSPLPQRNLRRTLGLQEPHSLKYH